MTLSEVKSLLSHATLYGLLDIDMCAAWSPSFHCKVIVSGWNFARVPSQRNTLSAPYFRICTHAHTHFPPQPQLRLQITMQPPFKSTTFAATGVPPPKMLVPELAFLSSALPPTLRAPDLERSLLIEPDRWTFQVANLVLANRSPISAVVPVLVTLEQVYAMQELELKTRELDCGIEELNKVLEAERAKVKVWMKTEE